jgi:hypothetical protein
MKRACFYMRRPLSPSEHDYLDACARIRDVTVTRLVEQLLVAIVEDQMVLSILDDESKRKRVKGQWKYRDGRKADSQAAHPQAEEGH